MDFTTSSLIYPWKASIYLNLFRCSWAVTGRSFFFLPFFLLAGSVACLENPWKSVWTKACLQIQSYFYLRIEQTVDRNNINTVFIYLFFLALPCFQIFSFFMFSFRAATITVIVIIWMVENVIIIVDQLSVSVSQSPRWRPQMSTTQRSSIRCQEPRKYSHLRGWNPRILAVFVLKKWLKLIYID